MSASSKPSIACHRPPWGSANTPFLVVGLLAVLIIGAAIGWSQWRPQTLVNLMPAGELREHDLNRMLLAFGQAGLNDFEIREGQVFVPQSQRDRFLKALATRDVLPDADQEMYDNPAHNPWATSEQQQETSLWRKKKMIRSLVMQLDFVADAIVDYDELEEPGWPPKTHRSSAVVVRSKEDRVLEAYQVEAIRNTICGAVAGLSPEDIVVTDISAGHAYVGKNVEDEPCPTDHLSRLRQAKLQQRIRDQLASLGEGIGVAVTVIAADPTTELTPPIKPEEGVLDESCAPLANQPAAIEASADQPTVTNTPAPNSSGQTLLQIDITVSQTCVESESNFPRNGSASLASLEQSFRGLQSKIVAAIRPLVSGEGHLWDQHAINITMIPTPRIELVQPSNSAITLAWVKENAPALGVGLGVFIFLCGLASWRLSCARRSHDTRQNVADEVRVERRLPPSRNSADAIPDETKRKLKQMVDDNPDQAAEIIKQWIRGAA